MSTDHAHEVIAAATNGQYELALMIISGLSLVVSVLVSVLVKLLSSRFTSLERTVSQIRVEVTEIDRLVVGEYVKRPELEKAIDRIVEAQREERRQVMELLESIRIGLSKKVDRDDCDRWHGLHQRP